LRPEKVARPRKPNGTGIQVAARKTLRKLLEPLSGLAFDCGLSISEVNSILREAAVRGAARRQLEDEKRINISGIAAATGVSRAEISRILRDGWAAPELIDDRHQNLANKILRAWHRDPRFLTSNRLPAALKLYGRGPTFEFLVRQYGRGLPTRAVFDQLTRIGAIELSASQQVSPKMSVAVDRRITPQMIKAYGSWATDLLSTKLLNATKSDASTSKSPKLRAKKSSKYDSKRRRNFRRAD
jgi:Family of unknown function (DUF6502)